MRRVELCGQYSLLRLEGVPYLLPYGQSVAEHRRGVRLDEAGVEAWEALLAADSVDAFVEARLRASGAQGSAREEERHDLLAFVEALRAMGVLSQETEARVPHPARVMVAGGLRVGFSGRLALLKDAFSPFYVDDLEAPCDQVVSVLHMPLPPLVGVRLVIQTDELSVLEASNVWVLQFRMSPALYGAHVARDGSWARFYVGTPKRGEEDALRDDLFHAIRFGFLVLAQQRGRTVLHSCSVRYRDRAVLFSGSSGTGKSTHARLWEREFGVEQLNGDLNVLYVDEAGQARVCGLPWCGTSGISRVYDLPLEAVVLLRQAPRDQVQGLTPDECQLFLMNRLITPSWDAETLSQNVCVAGEIARATSICRLLATRKPSAAHVMRAQVDAWIDGAEA